MAYAGQIIENPVSGERIHFLAPSGDGMVSEIAENRPGAYISIRHLGFLVKGVEDTESDAVRAWAPAYENYTFVDKNGGTELSVEMDIESKEKETFDTMWSDALARLKEIADQATRQGIRTIAPNVQDAASMTLLFSSGVDYVQGDFLAAAGPDMTYDFS